MRFSTFSFHFFLLSIMNNMFAFVFSIIIGNNYNYIIYFLVSFFSHFLLVSAHRCVCDFCTINVHHDTNIGSSSSSFYSYSRALFWKPRHCYFVFLLHRVLVYVFVLFKYKLCFHFISCAGFLFVLFNSFLYKAQFSFFFFIE